MRDLDDSSGARLADSVIAQAAEAMIVLDRGGLITSANAAAVPLAGGDPVGRAFGEAFPLAAPGPGSGPFAEDLLARIRAGETLRSVEARLARTSASGPGTAPPRILLVSGRALLGPEPNDGPLGAIVTLVDVTELRAMQARLQLADRLASVGTLAAGIAHELNNPLAYVTANVAYAIEELDAARTEGRVGPWVDDLVQALREAYAGAERMRGIVRDVKTFARADGEGRGPVVLARVLEGAIAIVQNELRHRARVVREIADLPPVLGDEGRLGQVFVNLLLNAAQAITEGAAAANEVRITAALVGDRVVVAIRDTGPGIPEPVLARIFDPFFTTKKIDTGTGLGLSICHAIVTALGGEIVAENLPGGGAEFRVLLPVAEEPRSSASLRVAARRGRILVVDDEPLVAQAVARALAAQHEVAIALGAREALALLENGESFDLVLCDLMMPEMSGMDLHAALAAHAPTLLPKIVFLTGGAFTPRAAAFLDTVPNPRIEKPFDPRALRALVRERLG
jgi:signal transduction histidine kinase/CheY-like chemotaxis protein